MNFTVGFFSENLYVDQYRDIDVDVEIMPIIPPLKHGFIIKRKAINWYNREHKFVKYLCSYIQKKKFDIILMNNSIFESKNFINAANRLRLPIVIWERGLIKYRREDVKASKQVDASIAMSDAILDNIRGYKFQSRTMKRIYDGVEPATFQGPFDKIAIKKELNIPAESRVIGIIGNVRVWKGQKYFIEAFKLLAPMYPNLYGLIIGGWSEMDLEYLRSLQLDVDNAGMKNRIRFLGYRKDISALLSILDVSVHASIQPEPFGMVLPEAMAAKVPVVATRFGGPLEIFNHGECGALVPPENGRAIADECKNYLSDEIYRRNIVEKAYQRLCEKFHIKLTVNHVEDLIAMMIGDKTGR